MAPGKSQTQRSLPSLNDLQLLNEQVAVEIIKYVDRANTRDTTHRIVGMGCATVSFLSCIGAFVYLVMNGHTGAGTGIVLGAGVLGVVKVMIKPN
ncbi:hypothetical protein [Edaphobacter aggregans]|uniref:hypothetical protein n=1 Tax=Edaphobacter aggregans TaxID=570835 RepID=UPI0005580E84|nr:hypothetical protein [Edaphobacter aggregans]